MKLERQAGFCLAAEGDVVADETVNVSNVCEGSQPQPPEIEEIGRASCRERVS